MLILCLIQCVALYFIDHICGHLFSNYNLTAILSSWADGLTGSGESP